MEQKHKESEGKPNVKTGRGPEIKEKGTTTVLHATAK